MWRGFCQLHSASHRTLGNCLPSLFIFPQGGLVMLQMLRVRPRESRTSSLRKSNYRPMLEIMEDRQLPAASFFQPFSLVSDQAGMAAIQDPNLVNAWGIA